MSRTLLAHYTLCVLNAFLLAQHQVLAFTLPGSRSEFVLSTFVSSLIPLKFGFPFTNRPAFFAAHPTILPSHDPAFTFCRLLNHRRLEEFSLSLITNRLLTSVQIVDSKA